MPRRLIYWTRTHHIAPTEAITVPYLIWASVVLHSTPAVHVKASPVHRHLTAFAPLWVWEMALASCAVVIVGALIFNRIRMARYAYIAAGVLWILLVWVLWQSTHARLVTGPYVALALTTLWRAGDLAVRDE